MTDLIWIGNALYPRWLVFAVLFGVIAAVAAFSAWRATTDGALK